MAGALGVREVLNYSEDLAKSQVEALVKTKVGDYLREEGHRQISSTVEAEREDLMIYAKQQIQLQMGPIGALVKQDSGTMLQRNLDYSQMMLAVRNSGQEGSTVGFAVAAALEYQIKKTLNQQVRISPRYIYYFARLREGTTATDSGAMISDAIRVIAERGAVAESAWPYRSGEYAQSPPDLKNARYYKIQRSSSLISLSQIKEALRSNGPVVAGISVFSSFESSAVTKTGMVPMPSKGEAIIGGHAICLVGYDDDRQLLKFLNQWGETWGDRGYGYLPYAYISANSTDVMAISM